MSARTAALRLAALYALKDAITTAYNEARKEAEDELDPSDRKSAVLPNGANIGTISYTKGSFTAKVTDPDLLLGWVKDNAPGEVVTVETVRESYVKALLGRVKDSDGAAYDAKTGEVIPGVEFVHGDPYVKTAQTAEQREAFIAAWQRGEVPGVSLGAALTPELPAGES